MCASKKLLLYISTFFSLLLIAKADLKFCYNGRQQLKTKPSTNHSVHLHCPYGLLFKEPVIIGAVEHTASSSDLELFCFGNNICSLDSWQCTDKLQYTRAQLIVPQKVITTPIVSIIGDEKINSDVPLCTNDMDEDYSMANDIETRKRKKRQVSQVSSNPTMEDKKKRPDLVIQSVIDEHTKRMFYFISGVNIEEVSSHLRVTKLLHHAVRLVHMICDPLYLKEEFLDYVEDGFMFLLKQQGLERLTDVDSDDFALLQRALEYCMGDPDATIFIDKGNHCPANFYIESVRRKKVSIPFDRADEANFVWGKYDIVVDAAWHIIDIVHGMCFATFKENLNLHHKFQVVMEQLFHDSLHLRWSSVTKFLHEERLDNVFTVNVNASMEVLDACAQGAYIGSPFLHRLQRPELNTRSRKKRSLYQIPPKDLQEMTYCLKSSDELFEKTRLLQEKQCG